MVIKWRICKDKISLKCRMKIICKCICLIWSKISIYTTNSHIHLGHLPGICICFLTIYRYSTSFSTMRLNKLGTLYKHTS